MIINAIIAVSKIVKEFRKTRSWASEEERQGFESALKKELDILSDNDPDNDPERWVKSFKKNQEE